MSYKGSGEYLDFKSWEKEVWRMHFALWEMEMLEDDD